MQAAQLVLGLLVVVAVLVTVSRRLRVPYPVLLLVGGLALGSIPGIPRIDLGSDTLLALVLPPIVYVAAFFTPSRGFRQDLGNIGSLAIGLVLASTFAVAGVALAVVPGISVPIAIALGAIVSPPDEVAATAVMQRLAVPRRIIALLDGEALLNDATALIVYRVALTAAVTSVAVVTIQPLVNFFVVAIGGIAIGLAVGWLIAQVRSRLEDVPVELTVSFATPYLAYVSADLLGVSGILAAVTTGLYLGRRSSQIMGSDVRVAGRAVWEMVLFLLNGVVFLMIGLEISALGRSMDRGALLELAGAGLLVSVTLIAVRALWLAGLGAWQRLVSRERPPLRAAEIGVLSWSGMRGVVSLAAALAIPNTINDGSPLPARAAVIVITFTVILVTLVGQGLTLPLVIKAVRLGVDKNAREEEANARRELLDDAMRRLEELYKQFPDHKPLLKQIKDTYQHRAEHEEQYDEKPGSAAEQELVEHRQIRRAVIDAQRDGLLRLRDRGSIDDDVLRNIERDLDLEELRMEA